jgi:hypothetical protein
VGDCAAGDPRPAPSGGFENVIGLRPEPGGYGSQTMTGKAYHPDGGEAGGVCDSKVNQGEFSHGRKSVKAGQEAERKAARKGGG